mgnify:CR=1 FL=1
MIPPSSMRELAKCRLLLDSSSVLLALLTLKVVELRHHDTLGGGRVVNAAGLRGS